MRQPTAASVVKALRARGTRANVAGLARYGITGPGRLGVSVPVMRAIAKEAGRNHALALALWKTGIPDARMVASMVAEPDRLTSAQMNAWVRDFGSWDVCDQVCDNAFQHSPLAWRKVREWAPRREEFVRRAAFALLACLAWHDKRAGNATFVRTFPLLRRAATDERNFVKKAVNWALRNIGKRNRPLNRGALAEAVCIRRLGTPAARWIAADAIRELSSAAVRRRLSRQPV